MRRDQSRVSLPQTHVIEVLCVFTGDAIQAWIPVIPEM